MTELELMANEEARHGNREALERLEAELREARMTELAALGQAQEAYAAQQRLEREAELQAQEIDKTRRRADKWQSMVLDCEEYLKPGETPRQRMDRDHADVLALIKMLETEKRKSERLEAQQAKAIEALQKMDVGEGWAAQIARTTLAELKGGKDE